MGTSAFGDASTIADDTTCRSNVVQHGRDREMWQHFEASRCRRDLPDDANLFRSRGDQRCTTCKHHDAEQEFECRKYKIKSFVCSHCKEQKPFQCAECKDRISRLGDLMSLGEVEEERLPLDATGPSVSRAVCILFDLNYSLFISERNQIIILILWEPTGCCTCDRM